MADEKLRIVIDALNQASDDLIKLKTELGSLDEQTQKSDKSSKNFGQTWAGVLTGLNSGIQIAKSAAAAVKEIYETAKEGAALEFAETKFDNLSRAIDTTANALLVDLRGATNGMYSDADLMASATDMMSLGLAKSHDEVVRLSSVSSALGMDMNQLVLTLTNQTTMRFDALGVSVDGFDEKVKNLEASGMSAQDAFTEAFLQQAEEQIEKVGSAADTTEGSFQKFEAAIKNSTDRMKENIIEGETLTRILDGMTESMTESYQWRTLLDAATEEGIFTQGEYTKAVLAVNSGEMELTDSIAWLIQLLKEHEEAIAESARLTEEWALANDQGYAAAQLAAQGVEDINSAVIPANIALKEMNEQLLFQIATEGLTAEETLAVARAMGIANEETVALYGEINTLKGNMDDSQESLDEYAGAMGDLNWWLATMPKDVDINVTTTYLEVRGRSQSGNSHGGNTEQTRASGGPTMAGMPYIWNEYGGEARVDSNNGFVLSRADAERAVSGRGGTQYVYGGPTASEIGREVRDALLTSGILI